jgi:hypothetical protein
MRRSSRAAAVTGGAVVLPAAARGTAAEKSLSWPAASVFHASELRVHLPVESAGRLTRTVPGHHGRGRAPLMTDRPRSRSCAAPGKDCQ